MEETSTYPSAAASFRIWACSAIRQLATFVAVPVVLLLLCLHAEASWASSSAGKVERIGAVAQAGVSDGLRQALDEKGYRVSLNDGWTAEFWFVTALAPAQKDSPGALYPELSNAELVGVVSLPKGMSDFRGQAVPAGTYTLRYQLIPQDGNHMGVSPNPDVLLAIPLASDANPQAKYLLRKLVSLSAQTTGAHPAVIAMEAAGEPGSVVEDAEKMVVLTVEISDTAGQKKKVGIVLKGQAGQ